MHGRQSPVLQKGHAPGIRHDLHKAHFQWPRIKLAPTLSLPRFAALRKGGDLLLAMRSFEGILLSGL